MTRPRGVWWSLFAEFLIAALAEGLVAGLGWVIRKARKHLRKTRKRKRED